MTNGIVSVTKKGKVILKAIAGCNGDNARKLADEIRSKNMATASEIYDAAQKVDFGCDDCLVVMTKEDVIYDRTGELHQRYLETFANPSFNPRWKNGTAEYVEIVEIVEMEKK